ncbi:MAG TPA: hypothetical protein VJ508_07530, partial [Saprospiraceae bacterium]|nr:hypothetical protein [Saprospiraceae bacterium]
MKKEYHLTISRKDRIYLVLFSLALLAWELGKKIILFQGQDKMEILAAEPDSCMMTMTSTHQKYATKFDTVSTRNQEMNPTDEPQLDPSFENDPKLPVSIMTASVDQLLDIGFSRRTALTLKKYISAGGRIQDEKKLMTIYGMDSLQLKTVLPYLIFPQTH